MFQSLHRAPLYVCMLLLLMVSNSAQASVFDYPRDANFRVIEYSQSHQMILNADPIPMLRIYGNGRVLVHFPVYMKRAGDYEMQISDIEVQALLTLLEEKGILKFSNIELTKIKEQVFATRQLIEPGKVVLQRSDNSHSRFNIKLDSYIPGLSLIPQYEFNKEVVMKNLRFDARSNPGITQLQNAADAEQVLRGFLSHRDLRKIK